MSLGGYLPSPVKALGIPKKNDEVRRLFEVAEGIFRFCAVN